MVNRANIQKRVSKNVGHGKNLILRLSTSAAGAILPLLLASAPPAFAASDSPPLSAADMRVLDGRVATIGHRLAVANRDLCADQVWRAGLVLQDLSQFDASDRPLVIRVFGLDAGPGVQALALGGPAERAGLRPDDILTAIEGVPPPAGPMTREGSPDRMNAILDALDHAFADGSAVLSVRRADAARDIAIQAERGCAMRFQLVLSRRLNARADGRVVELTTAIANYVADDAELAAVLAHEFAHNILHHRARLDRAGVERGFLGNFGRNARLIRASEEEADRLSVYLLDRGGYDPGAAVRFSERFAGHGLNFLGSSTHGSWRSRIAVLRDAVERVRRARARGEVPMPPAFDTGPAIPPCSTSR